MRRYMGRWFVEDAVEERRNSTIRVDVEFVRMFDVLDASLTPSLAASDTSVAVDVVYFPRASQRLVPATIVANEKVSQLTATELS